MLCCLCRFQARRALLQLDADHNRRLTLEEFVLVAELAGQPTSPTEAATEFAAAGKSVSDTGTILFDEFCTWYASC
jgi:hypothetical protein